MKISFLIFSMMFSGCKYLNRDNQTKDDGGNAPSTFLLDTFKASLIQAGAGLTVPASSILLNDEKDPAIKAADKQERPRTVKWNSGLKANFIKAGLNLTILHDALADYFATVSDLIFFEKGSKFFEDSPDKLNQTYETVYDQALNPTTVESNLLYLVPTIQFIDNDNVCFRFAFEQTDFKIIEFKDLKKGAPDQGQNVSVVEFDDYSLSNPLPPKAVVSIPVALSFFKTTSASLKYEIKTAPLGKALTSLTGDSLFSECDNASCLVTIDNSGKTTGCQKFTLN